MLRTVPERMGKIGFNHPLLQRNVQGGIREYGSGEFGEGNIPIDLLPGAYAFVEPDHKGQPESLPGGMPIDLVSDGFPGERCADTVREQLPPMRKGGRRT